MWLDLVILKGQSLKNSSKKELVKLTNCIVKKAYSGDDSLELIIQDGTDISKSDKHLVIEFPESVTSVEPEDMRDINLGDLEEQSPFQRVGITVKALAVADVTTLDRDCQFQSVTIADLSGTAELDLWQGYVGAVTPANRTAFAMQWLSATTISFE